MVKLYLKTATTELFRIEEASFVYFKVNRFKIELNKKIELHEKLSERPITEYNIVKIESYLEGFRK